MIKIWSGFRALPRGAQIFAWAMIAPFLAALFLAAPAVEVSAPRVQTPAMNEVSPSPSPSPSPDPVPSPSPSPSPSPIASTPSGVPPSAQKGIVEKIVDGDTIWLRVDEPGGALQPGATHKIRLLEIDTPEVGRCWASEATRFLSEEIGVGSSVFVLADREDKDRYGRFLRYIWDSSGEFINLKSAREGHAKAVLYMPNDMYITEMRAAADDARAAGRGLWGACGQAAAAPPPVNAAPPSGSSGSGCHPSYADVCIPKDVEDADCAGGSGDGPYYVEGPFRVVGPDVFRLDHDKDGIGCE